MSNEELAERIRDGDESLIPQLWEQVTPFITWKAQHYTKAFVGRGDTLSFELDDLVQESYFAMLKAIDYFNAEKGSFLHILELQCRYAFAVVAGLRGAKRNIDAMRYAVSANVPLADDSDNTLLDIIPDDSPALDDVATAAVYQQQLHNTLEQALTGLTTRQETVLRRRYYHGETQDRIASDLGCTSTAIGKCEQTALHQLYNARTLNGLSEFLETHTNYYSYVGLTHFKDTGESAVETIAIRRENLAKSWLAARRSKGDSNDEA